MESRALFLPTQQNFENQSQAEEKAMIRRKQPTSPSIIRLRIPVVVLFSILVSLVGVALGQSGTGYPAFSSMSGGVNLANLNVHYQFPIVNKPGRGLSFHSALNYDTATYGPGLSHTPKFGWDTQGGSLGFVGYSAVVCPTKSSATNYTNWFYTDGNGTPHPFDSATTKMIVSTDPSCGPSTARAMAADQTGYSISISSTPAVTSLKDSAGDTLVVPLQSSYGAASITDRNGNVISTDGTNFTDTLGVKVLSVSSSFVGADNSILASQTFTYNTTVGNASVVVTYKTYGMRTAFQCPGQQEASGGATLVDSITYADGSKYSFQYEPSPGIPYPNWITGRLTSITLPTGGVVSYSYPGPNSGVFCSDDSTAQMTTTTSDGTWNYVRSGTGSSFTTTVTDPQGDQTVYTFQNGIETQRQIYQGNASGGTPLRTVTSCYNGNDSDCVHQPVNTPITRQDIYSALPTGLTLRRDTFLDGTTGATNEVDEYDWGTPGPLLRKTVYAYLPDPGNNILNLPFSVSVIDVPSGQTISRTYYGYDETPVTSTSGLPQHNTVSHARSNLTSVQRSLNTTGTLQTTRSTYDDAGNVLSLTTPLGYTLGYTTSFTYGNNGAYVTQVNLPDTSSPNQTHHQTSATYDTNSGLLLSSTDQNGQPTSYSYDNMLRQILVSYPDGGQTKTNYYSPNSTSVQQSIDGSRWTWFGSLTDAYGRPSRTTVGNDEGGFDQQDVCYNSLGQVAFKSYPYQGSGWQTPQVCSGAGDSYAYDGLGHVLGITHSDGSAISYTYAGRATQVADEGNGSTSVTRITQSDGLGRLTAVCEVSGASQFGNGGAPGACNLDISATGFLTNYNYSYDSTGNLITTVNQGSLFPRTFVHDSLGELIAETEPEWIGTAPPFGNYPATYGPSSTTYSYDADGDLITRVRPKPNQSDPTITTTTHYVYDALHRLTLRWYGDNTTPNAYFNYDEASPAGLFNATNPIGRLTSERNNSGTSSALSYDPMGRVISEWQCPAGCAQQSAYRQQSYSYDLGGDMINSSSAASTWNYGYNIAGRPVSVTSTPSDLAHPGTLLSNVHYNAFGEQISTQMGNFTPTTGLAESDGYDARGRLNYIFTSVNTAAGNVGMLGSSYGLAPNGALTSLGDGASLNWAFTYDDFNRLQTTNNPLSAAYSYKYDRYGNRWQQNGANSWNQTFDQNNHIVGWSYDAVGNLLSDGLHSYTYDGEGRMLTVDGGSSNGGTTYVYDADQRRVARMTGSSLPRYFLYDLSDRDVEEYDSAVDHRHETYVGGRHLATYVDAPANGSLTIGGNLQSTVVGAYSGASGTGSVSISGADRKVLVQPGGQRCIPHSGCFYVPPVYGYDSGTVTITINGSAYSVNYGQGDTSLSVVQNLSNAINGGNLVTATPSGGASSATISLAATSMGASTNYSLSFVATSNSSFGPSFTTNAGPSLTGGRDANPGTVVWDSGTMTVTVGSGSSTFTASAPFAQNGNNSPALVASALAGNGPTGLNRPGSTVTATVAGATISIVGLNGATNIPVTTSLSWNNSYFGAPSFSDCPGMGSNCSSSLSRGKVYFSSLDRIHDERVRTTQDGSGVDSCLSLPFGDALTCWGNQPFQAGPLYLADTERDSESGLDHMGFRQYASIEGRFTSPDPLDGSMDSSDPQSLNRYVYAHNNPLNFTDPSGLLGPPDGPPPSWWDPPRELWDQLYPGFHPEMPEPYRVPSWLGGDFGVPRSNSIFDSGTGLPDWLTLQGPGLLSIFFPQAQGCEFGPCDMGAPDLGFQSGHKPDNLYLAPDDPCGPNHQDLGPCFDEYFGWAPVIANGLMLELDAVDCKLTEAAETKTGRVILIGGGITLAIAGQEELALAAGAYELHAVVNDISGKCKLVEQQLKEYSPKR